MLVGKQLSARPRLAIFQRAAYRLCLDDRGRKKIIRTRSCNHGVGAVVGASCSGSDVARELRH